MSNTHSIMFHHFHDEKHAKSEGSLSSSEFSEMIDWLSKKFKLLGAKEYLINNNAGNLDSDDICLSFDDALLCQYDVALPVLNQKGLSAFFFVYSSALSGEPDKLEIYRYFRTNAYDSIDDFYEDFFGMVNSHFESQLSFHKDKFLKLDYLSAYPFYSKNDRWFRYLRDHFLEQSTYNDFMQDLMHGKNFNTNEIIDRLWMSESNLKEISKKGHLIGLHSFSHPTRISKLNYHEQKNEYVTNYRHLENLVGKIVSMSHPCGDYNSDTLSILKDLGIQIGFRSSLEPNEIKSKSEIPREDHVNILNQMKL